MSEHEYNIGDVVNGHRLGEDHQWHPVNAGPPQGNPKADAKAAKAYYKASRPWYKKKRIMIPLALVVIMGIGAVGGGGGDDAGDTTSASASDTSNDTSAASETEAEPTEEAEAPKPKAKPKPEPKPKAMRVEAEAILAEFEGNEAVADQKYKGKDLIVTGNAAKVDTDWLDEEQYIVQVDDGSEYAIFTVNCNGVSTAQALKVQTGTPITVRGTFDDGGDLGVELKDCEVV